MSVVIFVIVVVVAEEVVVLVVAEVVLMVVVVILVGRVTLWCADLYKPLHLTTSLQHICVLIVASTS